MLQELKMQGPVPSSLGVEASARRLLSACGCPGALSAPLGEPAGPQLPPAEVASWPKQDTGALSSHLEAMLCLSTTSPPPSLSRMIMIFNRCFLFPAIAKGCP